MPKDHRPAHAGPSPNLPEETQYDSPLLLVTRLYWMGFGPIFAVLLLIAVATNASGWLTATDAIFAGALALLPLSRWIEFPMGKAERAAGGPATLSNLRNYALLIAAGGLGAWIVAKLIGMYVLGG